MKNIKINLIVLIMTIVTTGAAFSQTETNRQKENVVAQMNYCINSLTNIIHNKSMSVLEHESDQILNNLTIEQIIGLYEINEFRINLLDAISKFGITEQERALLRRVQSIKRDNVKWAALSNALSPTMLLTGKNSKVQIAFQALLTAARSTVEYQTLADDQNIEELRAMWVLREEDLKEINEIRKEALKAVFSLYNKYHLSEKDRLTEATADNFSLYISEDNAAKRVRLLEDNRAIYEHMADYYYHLGMAYIDLGNYTKAKKHLNTYLEKYQKAPLLRYDEKSGCVALAILTNEKQLSHWEKKYHLDNALKNLPHNSAAVLQCAMVYLYELKEEEKALGLIRAGIEDPKASDKSLLYMAAANLLPVAKKYPKLYAEICSLFEEGDKVTLDAYVTYIMHGDKNEWKELSKLILFENCSAWFGFSFNENLHIVLPENSTYDPGDISIYLEEHTSDQVAIKQLNTSFLYGVDISDMNDVDCFKAYKALKYLYFDVLVPGKTFILKRDIDYDKIQSEEWHRQSEFKLTQDDIDDIIKFCKDNAPKSYATTLQCKAWGGDWVDHTIDSMKVRFRGDTLKYKAHHSHKQLGYYLRITFTNGVHLMYAYKGETFVPYMFTFNDKMYFATEEYKKEYEYQGSKEPSWYEKSWDKMTNTFSDSKNNTDREETKEERTNKSSWTKKAKERINSWFSDEEKKTE